MWDEMISRPGQTEPGAGVPRRAGNRGGTAPVRDDGMSAVEMRLSLPRRTVLGAVGGVAAAWIAGGCALHSRSSRSVAGQLTATPTAASAKIVLTFQPWQDAYQFQSIKGLNRILYEATASFRAKNPSVDLRFFGPQTNPVTSVIAGQGPDVPQLQGGGGGISGWINSGTLLDLTPYLRSANLALNRFSPGQIANVTAGRRIFGIPNYTGVSAMAVNLSALDAFGLAYPPPKWTHLEWAALARAVSGRTVHGQRVVGTTILPHYGPGPSIFYYHGWGGGMVDAANPTRCLIDSSSAISCAQFLYDLVDEGAAQWGSGMPPTTFIQGLGVAPFCWVQTNIIPAATTWRGFTWDWWPMPLWPHGPAAMTNPNFFAIAASTKHPHAAWDLLHWLTFDPEWQRMLMRTVLLPPGYLPLWGEWIATVRHVAPTLAKKNLETFAQNLSHSWLGGGEHFAFESPQATAILGNWYGQIAARKVSVKDGLTQAAREINRFEGVTAEHPPVTTSYATKHRAYEKFQTRMMQMFQGGLPQGVSQ